MPKILSFCRQRTDFAKILGRSVSSLGTHWKVHFFTLQLIYLVRAFPVCKWHLVGFIIPSQQLLWSKLSSEGGILIWSFFMEFEMCCLNFIQVRSF